MPQPLHPRLPLGTKRARATRLRTTQSRGRPDVHLRPAQPLMERLRWVRLLRIPEPSRELLRVSTKRVFLDRSPGARWRPWQPGPVVRA